MPSRRDVLEAGVVWTAMPVLGGGWLAPEASPAWRGDVLLDERLAASRAFADVFAAAFGPGLDPAPAAGGRVHSGRGDWSFLWSSHLQRAWGADPAPLAAVTHHGPWFTFQHLARPRGLRLLFSAELRRGDGALRVSGPRAAVDAALRTADLDDERWGQHLARIIGALSPAEAARTVQGEVPCPRARGEEPLYAWMLAPSRRAPRFVS